MNTGFRAPVIALSGHPPFDFSVVQQRDKIPKETYDYVFYIPPQ